MLRLWPVLYSQCDIVCIYSACVSEQAYVRQVMRQCTFNFSEVLACLGQKWCLERLMLGTPGLLLDKDKLSGITYSVKYLILFPYIPTWLLICRAIDALVNITRASAGLHTMCQCIQTEIQCLNTVLSYLPSVLTNQCLVVQPSIISALLVQ